MSLLFNRICVVIILLPLLAICIAIEVLKTILEIFVDFPELVKAMWYPKYPQLWKKG